MTLRCWRRSMTASRPAHSASADFPVPARPPMLTMPISGSSSRSSATRCSADRPCRPNASRSPRTSWTCLSGRTRPGALALPLALHSTSPVWQGKSRAASRSSHSVLVQRLDVVTADGQLRHARPARVHGQLRAVLLRLQADRGGLDPQRHVLADQDHVVTLVGEAAGYGEDAGVVVPEPEAGRAGPARRCG